MPRQAKPRRAKAKGASRGRTPPSRAASQHRLVAERLREAHEQQAATSEVLRVIASSPGDPQPVFDMIAERAMALCGALHAGVLNFDGHLIHLVAHAHAKPEFVETIRRLYPMAPGRSTAGARAILTRAIVHIPDIGADPEYRIGATARASGFRSTLGVPMLRDGPALGALKVSYTHQTQPTKRIV